MPHHSGMAIASGLSMPVSSEILTVRCRLCTNYWRCTLITTQAMQASVWPRAYVTTHYPQVLVDGRVDEEKLLQLPHADRVKLGEVLFQYQCNDCHSPQGGYSAVDQLIVGWTPQMIELMVRNLEKGRFFMPPWSGTDAEAQLLTEYLTTIAPPRPPGMR